MHKLSKRVVNIRRFKKFLYDNDILEEWYRNARKNKNINTFFSRVTSDEYLYAGFNWITTPEGFDFWIGIKDKWMDVVEKEGLK